MQASIKCCLDKEQILSDSFMPQLGQISFSDKSTGEFKMELTRYQGQDFADPVEDPTAVVWLDQELFIAVNLDSTPNVGMFIETCVASTSATAGEGTEHQLITDG